MRRGARGPKYQTMQRDVAGTTLPSAGDFFQRGVENSVLENCVSCCGDLHRISCSPKPCCLPCQNGCCLLSYNVCAGASAGVFITPDWCPCGLCTCCCPLKAFDVTCCVCRTPEERCDSFRYLGQRFLFAGASGIDRLYPTPPSVSERDAYKGRDGPWPGANPNQFVAWLESFGDLMT